MNIFITRWVRGNNVPLYEQLIANNSFDGLCLVERDGTCVYMNQAASAICSYPIHEVVGSNVKDALKNGDVADTGKVVEGEGVVELLSC